MGVTNLVFTVYEATREPRFTREKRLDFPGRRGITISWCSSSSTLGARQLQGNYVCIYGVRGNEAIASYSDIYASIN